MRDINRIQLILDKLKIYWLKNPDLRLGQIICNLGSEAIGNSDPFYIEDDLMLKVLEEKLKEQDYMKIDKLRSYLFLDFDFTCTYMYGIKEGLREFLEFCLDNFKVYWCSYADYSHIVEELDGNIPDDLLKRIIYKEVESNSKLEFIYSIIGDTKDFIYIDDDICSLDFSLLKNSNLLNNFIKAVNNKHDLKRIRDELEKKL